MTDEEDLRRLSRFARWESLGYELIKGDMANGGHRYVGGPPEARRLAAEWLRQKDRQMATSKGERDVAAEKAVQTAIESLIANGQRAYAHSVPLTAERVLVEEGKGRISAVEAGTRTQAAIVAMVDRGDLVASAEGHVDWLLKIPPEDEMVSRKVGSKIFIGHGRSAEWKELRDLITERLKLDYDEFNREATAGVATAQRLEEMLDHAAFAFLVMTAEDDTADGRKQARMNVVHEVGLFQGRLGFRKAIVLLEEGCEEFSNITGLGQIRFTKGNMAAKFEEIRKTLEREKII